MSDMAKQARAAMKAKAQRLGSDRSTEKVDSSSWTPPELLRADVKTGMRPISRRAYKSGGKVEGSKAGSNMGKSVRTGNKPITADSLVNKDMKEANEEREGYKHIGGLKSGGRAKKMVGGPMAGAAKMMQRAQAVGDVPGATMNFSPVKKGALSPLRGMKKGGSAEKHEDVAEDKALIKKMVKPAARTGKDDGGLAAAKLQVKKIPMGQSGLSAEDAAKWQKKTEISPSWQGGQPKGSAPDKDEPGYGYMKKGGRAKRATGGGIFSGPGYPGKVPGATGGRTAHARGGKAKGKTNINIIIGAGKPAGMGDMMPNPMGGPTKPPGMDGMPGGMPIAVPPPGGAPGAAPMPMPMPIPMPGPAGPAGPPGMPMPRKSGGRATSYKDMTAGAGSGKGRLEKTEIAERSARKVGGRTYSSYKDMDAGAGSGKGRLEKAEIASKTARIEPGNY
tara:strand:+ start:9519 stop:10859 length:1341 start_codon:yes stop_codon:yes gene_type:complete